ncbi:MAG: spermidine synthase [Gammaproteobacteria bacterium]
MAIVWQKVLNNVNYEVRTAGKTIRLYTDGVFHSQYRPNRHIIGGIWDLMVLPSFFYSSDKIQRVLLLGVGGGAVIHHLHHFHTPLDITGIELNPVHIDIAHRYFKITDKLATIIESDAQKWLKNYTGPAFDFIIDDLFSEEDGEPVRAIDADSNWFNLLEKNITTDGMLVINFISPKNLKECGYFKSRKIATKFESAIQFTLPAYENAIGAFVKKQVKSADLRKRIYHYSGINSESLPYRCRVF